MNNHVRTNVAADTTLSTTTMAFPFRSAELRFGGRKVLRIAAVLFLCMLFAIAMPGQPRGGAGIANSKTPAFTTFEAPNAGTAGGQGTAGAAINAAGDITGTCEDASDLVHGFVRASDGTITEFDAPGAGTGPGPGTVAVSINTGGEIAGYYVDTDHVNRGFVRAKNGTITDFNVLGSWTSVGAINAAGDITGYYAVPGVEASRGFVRTSDGTITTFEGDYVIVPFGINTTANIAGYYLDADLKYHGFVRASDGKITKFHLPGGPGLGSYAGGFNA
jgi:hypothetical protein